MMVMATSHPASLVLRGSSPAISSLERLRSIFHREPVVEKPIPAVQQTPLPKRIQNLLVDADKIVPASEQVDYRTQYRCFLNFPCSGSKLADLSERFRSTQSSEGVEVGVVIQRKEFNPECKVILTIERDPPLFDQKGVIVLEGPDKKVVLSGVRESNPSFVLFTFAFDVRRLEGIDSIKCYLENF